MASGFPLEVNGIRIRSSEALYQACRFPHLPDVQRLIIREYSPMTAKMRSKPHRKQTRPDWEKVRVPIMRWCLRVKLAQNWHKFGNLLLATEDRPIVEESRKDAFWGAKPIDHETLEGKNVLGRLLMELREELGKNGDKLVRVEPLTIPQFLLFGRAIAVLGSHEQVPFGHEEHLGVAVSDAGIQATEAASYAQPLDPKPTPSVREPHAQDITSRGCLIPKECKRLAEVDFPIAAVSKHSVREKSIRHGHPSTLHLWWARRPLAACRAMLLALLLPDPADSNCPEDFKKEARKILAPLPVALAPDGEGLRKALLKFIGDFSNWDLSTSAVYLEAGRALVKAAHGDEPPLVVDPFAGGGSIPLEALRLGCEAFASDLNPVACLILKVMLEDMPRYGREKINVKKQSGEEVEAEGLAEALRIVGKEIKEKAEEELREFYPVESDGAKPIAYLWARTVRCEAPNCGGEIPLMRSFWLCKKPNRKRALRWEIKRQKEKGKNPEVVFEIFEPKSEKDVSFGTVTRAKATCLCCGTVLPPERVRAQLAAQGGGADAFFDKKGIRIGGARLLAVVTLKPGEQGRHYRLPAVQDYQAVWKALNRIKEILDKWEQGGRKDPCPFPDEPLPSKESHRAVGSQLPLYRLKTWGDLFTARQKVAIGTLVRLTMSLSTEPELKQPLSLALTRAANAGCSLCRWHVTGEKHEGVYSRQALPMVWDFSEGNPLSASTGGYEGAVEWVSRVADLWPKSEPGQVEMADAANSSLPRESVAVWFTDPPYYDAIPYADLSDFFFVWLKRVLPNHPLLRDPSNSRNPLTPKSAEAVQCEKVLTVEGKPKDKDFYETAMARAFSEGRRILKEDGIGSVVFAHKTTKGWEALLSGMTKGGWTITGSWPISTEMGTRLNARETASLATSVHLVCRRRPEDAPVGDWGDVLRELPNRVGNWMERLQGEGIRGADLVFACIGPALEIYSRYSKVVDAEDREIPLGGDPEAIEPHKRGYLAYVWEAVGKAALEQVLGSAEAKEGAGALEEDARLTALFLWTLQSTNGERKSEKEKGKSEKIEEEEEQLRDDEEDEEETSSKSKKGGFTLVFDVVRRFAQPLGIRLPDWEGRIIETKKGVVRLLPVRERAKQLFGDQGTKVAADEIEKTQAEVLQLRLFPKNVESRGPEIKGRGRRRAGQQGVQISDKALRSRMEATTLDRVHAAMLLQSGGRTNALRALLKAEVERGPDFLRLANALSALYPKESEEKRLVDAMLLALPR
jgi:putative DNA methylase